MSDFNFMENKHNFKWIINSTGSNTVGTTFSNDLKNKLEAEEFVKIHSGNPMYATEVDYSEEHIKSLCEDIMKMRLDYDQNSGQVGASYCKVDFLVNLSMDNFSSDE